MTNATPFKQIEMRCCGFNLRWLGYSMPAYCPACGKLVAVEIDRWITVNDPEAEVVMSGLRLRKGL